MYHNTNKASKPLALSRRASIALTLSLLHLLSSKSLLAQIDLGQRKLTVMKKKPPNSPKTHKTILVLSAVDIAALELSWTERNVLKVVTISDGPIVIKFANPQVHSPSVFLPLSPKLFCSRLDYLFVADHPNTPSSQVHNLSAHSTIRVIIEFQKPFFICSLGFGSIAA